MKLTKKQRAKLEEVKDYLDNLQNEDEWLDAVDKIREAWDKVQEKDSDKLTEKDEIIMEVGSEMDSLWESTIPDAVERLDTIISLVDSL